MEEEKFYTAKNRATRGGVKFFNFKKLKLQLALFPEIKVQSDGDEQTMEAFVDEMQRKVSEFSQRNFEHLLGKRLAQLQTAIEAICIEGRDEAIALEQAAKAFYDLDDIHFDEESEERSLKHKQSAERLKQFTDEILIPKIVEHLTATTGKRPPEVGQIMAWKVEPLMTLRNSLMGYISRYLKS